MTLPDERFRAVIAASNLLHDLLDNKKTPRVPKAIRQRAYSVLRHYPSYWDLNRASQGASDVFQPHIEDVQRMMMKYEQSKKEKSDDN